MNLQFFSMADGRRKNGGARPGSGRKTKAEILGFAALIDEAWPIARQKKVLKLLADDCEDNDFSKRHTARQLMLAYKFGKPKDTVEHQGETKQTIEVVYTKE